MLRLNVGTNRKIGQPDFGSAGASCNLELELDTALFQDLDGLQQVVRRAYAACNQAVNDELSRLTHHDGRQHHDAGQTHDQTHEPTPEPVVEIRTTPAINGATVTRIQPAQFTTQPSPRPATTSQVRAIRAICSRRKIDLVALLRDRYGIQTADELGIRQASALIDELKSDEPATSPGTNGHANGNGSGTYAVNGGAR
jgi:hypothetical protein